MLQRSVKARIVMRSCVLLTVFILAVAGYAASPTWVVSSLNNLRRAARVANAAKNGVKVAVAIGKCEHALSEAQIDDLAKIASRPKGLEAVGQTLGKMNLIQKYGDDVGHLILQDAYLRIAVRNGKISSELANSTLKNLSGTPGLTALLRKINTVDSHMAKGHLRELEIGIRASERDFKAVSFGQKFSDGLKRGDTDLDVFLTRGGKNYAIESKAYSGYVPNDMIRADAESLLAFSKEVSNTTPVFCFETAPSEFSLKWLSAKGVKVITGNAEEIASKLDVLSSCW